MVCHELPLGIEPLLYILGLETPSLPLSVHSVHTLSSANGSDGGAAVEGINTDLLGRAPHYDLCILFMRLQLLLLTMAD